MKTRQGVLILYAATKPAIIEQNPKGQECTRIVVYGFFSIFTIGIISDSIRFCVPTKINDTPRDGKTMIKILYLALSQAISAVFDMSNRLVEMSKNTLYPHAGQFTQQQKVSMAGFTVMGLENPDTLFYLQAFS